jgi:hypothetical protein
MLTQIFRRLIKAKPILLGRWCHKDKSKNDWKIDMANMDHCGTCANDSPNQENKLKSSSKSNPKDIYTSNTDLEKSKY